MHTTTTTLTVPLPLQGNQAAIITPLPSEPALRDGVFYIDNSGIELITTCPWKAYAQLILRRTVADPQPALIFGGHVHAALDYCYRRIALGMDPDLPNQLGLLEQRWQAEGGSTGDDWRSLGMAQEIVRKYHSEYGLETFDVLMHNGQPFVEQPFAIYLGEVLGIKIIYIGRMDLGIQDGHRKFIMDHKTTSMLGEGFWMDAAMSEQQRGYCYAFKECTGEEPYGYIINAIATRKPSKTGTSIEFQRKTFMTRFPEGQLDEWKENVLQQIEGFLWTLDRCNRPDTQTVFGNIPRHHKHCINKYGTCHFYRVCEKPPEQRLQVLYGPDYKANDWSPLLAEHVKGEVKGEAVVS
jgi:hypothetical protein